MYAKRIQIMSYGPIEQLDITLPFSSNNPKPVVLVGENGSGKSVLLSHVVNGLLIAQGIAFPDTPELELGRVFKLRSPFYIRRRNAGYYARVDFERDLHIEEMQLHRKKEEYSAIPREIDTSHGQDLWKRCQTTRLVVSI